MRSVMSFSERFCSGFALAATIAGDPGAEQARTGLQESAREPVSRVARELLSLAKAERRARVSALARPPRPARNAWPEQATAPLRAYALIAQREPPGTLPAFLRAAPLPRAGFIPEPGLLQLLKRLAFPESEAAAPQEPAAASSPPARPSRGKPGGGHGEPWGA